MCVRFFIAPIYLNQLLDYRVCSSIPARLLPTQKLGYKGGLIASLQPNNPPFFLWFVVACAKLKFLAASWNHPEVSIQGLTVGFTIT